MKRYSYIVIF